MSITLAGLKSHFAAVAATVSGIAAYEYTDARKLNAGNKSFPLLQFTPGSPASRLSGSDLQKGFAYETHRVILRLADTYTEAEKAAGDTPEKYDALQTLAMEFIYKAFAPAFARDYQLEGGTDNVVVNRRQQPAAFAEVEMEMNVRVYTGASQYITFNLLPDITTVWNALDNAGKTAFITSLSAAECNRYLDIVQRNSLNIIYTLPTGQSVSYATGDDGYYAHSRLTDHKNLKSVNAFSHYKRFTGKTGGYWDEVAGQFKTVDGVVTTEALSFPDAYTIDHATGLGWARGAYYTSLLAAGPKSWADAIAAAESAVWAGYTDWFMPNSNQITSLINRAYNDPVSGGRSAGDPSYALASNVVSRVWTATTSVYNTTYGEVYYSWDGTANNLLSNDPKTNNTLYFWFICRKHF
ncbi:MAG: DUF1566 domain-containing protein [Bacteroidota bacterium]|nr:DUF1566 domain-containing protein [Bacteroidota bacterium]